MQTRMLSRPPRKAGSASRRAAGALLLAALGGAAEGGGDDATENGDERLSSLDGSRWVLSDLGGGAPSGAESPVTLRFDGNRITGTSGCNRYFAEVRSEGSGTIAVGPVGATRMMCATAAMDLEDRYLEALAEVRRLRLANGNLVLSGGAGHGDAMLSFRAAPPGAEQPR
jgi:heat shock protein HslJ